MNLGLVAAQRAISIAKDDRDPGNGSATQGNLYEFVLSATILMIICWTRSVSRQ